MKKKKSTRKIVHDLRRPLNFKGLTEKNTAKNPIDQFERWIKIAVKTEKIEPNAVTLATVAKNGAPRARTVLIRGYGKEGFTFYTNYNSRKGRDLASNSNASIVFYWKSLSRQVLIEGKVKKVPQQVSEKYFQSRPRGSQIAAVASRQSKALKDRLELEKQIRKIELKYKGKEVPCPKDWGGYCLAPKRIEFWQGRPDRSHDRICYTKAASGRWKRERLAP